jgi:protein TonB
MTPTPSTTQLEEPQVESKTEQQEALQKAPGRAPKAVREAIPAEPLSVVKARPGLAELRAAAKARPLPEIFHGSLLDFSSTRPRRATRDFLASIVAHVIVLGLLVLTPFCFVESIDLAQFVQTRLVAPPPPAPPPPPAAPIVARSRPLPKRVLTAGGKLLAPTVIPESVAMLHEKPLPPEIESSGPGVAGGVPGGVPGGQLGGVLGSILTGGQQNVPPPPVASKPRAPVRVGGRVKEPRKLYAPAPAYPTLARQARIEGKVVIDAVIDIHGNVVNATVVSGPPLLLQAALEAVRTWRFEPTYLNEEPVPVELIVTVEFHLAE